MKFDDILSAIKKLDRSTGPILIGIEGFGGAGKSTLAHKLKDELRISVSLTGIPLSWAILSRYRPRTT